MTAPDSYSVTLQRRNGKRTSDEKIEKQIEHILGRGLGGERGRSWEVTSRVRHTPYRDGSLVVYKFDVSFKKTRGQKGGEAEYRQWEEIKAMLMQTGAGTKYAPYPWEVLENGAPAVTTVAVPGAVAGVVPATPIGVANGGPPPNDNPVTPGENTGMGGVVSELNNIITKLGGVREVQTTLTALKTWDDLEIPPELLGRQSDQHLAAHPAWRSLYGLGAQIRILLSNIKRAKDTEGKVRNHGVLFGHAGCGKTTTLLALENMFGPGAVLRLDATSTTRAGIEKLFFSDLPSVPPLVFMEEAEKADVEALKVWLGALDDRGEIRKVNFRVNQLREVRVLFLCTVNDKKAFDRMMGSDGSEAGALSSRCVSQVYFPRPTETTLRKILMKEIDSAGGNPDWVTPALEMAKGMDISDPRIVRSFLAGGDRLLDGTYQDDWKAVEEAKRAFGRA